MPESYNKVLGKSPRINRIIGRIDGTKPGPCLIFFGGIHGNEPLGVHTLNQVIAQLKKKQDLFHGTLIAIGGNLWALERSMRYQEADLNRMWTQDRLNVLADGTFIPKNEDEKQQLEIFRLLKDILINETGPFYFFDLHTTSSPTIPFITVNDSMLNRKFTKQYPLPLVLGIEEFLDGPLLSYINELGYVSFGFEGGQHDDLDSIKNLEVFIYLSLVFTGALPKNAVDYEEYIAHWNTFTQNYQRFYEIYHRFEVKENERFKMKPGFSNFQNINRDEILATINDKIIRSTGKSIIFMPLYQLKGSDGYFLIRKIPGFFLWLSSILRKYRMDRILILLPGIRWSSSLRDTMIVNRRVAPLITRQLLHLFGYRCKLKNDNYLIIKNREYRSRKQDYEQEKWFHGTVNLEDLK